MRRDGCFRGNYTGQKLSGAFLVYKSRHLRCDGRGKPLYPDDSVRTGAGTGAGEADGNCQLQELRRQVQMAKENGEKMEEKDVEKADEMKEMEEKTPNIESVSAEILVRHETYGCGKVVEEDDTMITVEFDGYGSKEFIKAFSCLEILNGQ